jgi:hypothetical protein
MNQRRNLGIVQWNASPKIWNSHFPIPIIQRQIRTRSYIEYLYHLELYLRWNHDISRGRRSFIHIIHKTWSLPLKETLKFQKVENIHLETKRSSDGKTESLLALTRASPLLRAWRRRQHKGTSLLKWTNPLFETVLQLPSTQFFRICICRKMNVDHGNSHFQIFWKSVDLSLVHDTDRYLFNIHQQAIEISLAWNKREARDGHPNNYGMI